MLGKIIMAGVFPLPISVNSLYKTNRNGDKILTKAGREFKEDVVSRICFGPKIEELQHEIHVDDAAVIELRQIMEALRKRRKITPAWLYLQILCVFQQNKGDADNLIKALQDAIMGDWLDYDDRYVADLPVKKVVDKEAHPHVEVVLRECAITWKSGDVITAAMQEIEQYKKQDGTFYNAPTLAERNLHNAITEVDLRQWRARTV